MSELLPCPFCGGEAETFAGIIIGGKNENVIVECANCGAKVFRIQEAEAIEAWNTRHVETCEFKPFRGPISDTDEAGDRRGVCSECSAYMHEQFNYCPNCGRKVSA